MQRTNLYKIYLILYFILAFILKTPSRRPFLEVHELFSIFLPIINISNPFTEISNWIPAPIPYYKKPQYFPYVKVNSRLSMCNESYSKSIPEDATLINCINNAVVFKNGQIMTSYFSWHNLAPFYNTKGSNSIDIRPIEHIDQGIYFFHPFHTCYFHFLIETFPLLYCFGDEIIKNSVILHGKFMKKPFNELFNILNLTIKRTIIVGTPVYVKKLYVSNPSFYDGCNPNALRHFRLQLLKKCNVFDIPSTENVIYNRKRSRFIKNFDEMVDALKSELPSYKFTILPNFRSIYQQVKFWRSARFAMMIHGSTISNILYMRPKAVAFEFARKDCRSTYVMLSHVLGIRLYEIMFQNQTRFYSMFAETSILIPAVRKIMKMLDKENLTEIFE